jgi:hypothetical protein
MATRRKKEEEPPNNNFSASALDFAKEDSSVYT